LKKLYIGFVCSLLIGLSAKAQMPFSITTDISLLRNLSPQQHFWTVGQTVQGQLHFSKKESGYAWLCYYTPGKFRNNYSAIAKSPLDSPATINYEVTGRWKYRQVSIGWRHYIKGSYNEQETWNLYSIVGFGLLLAKMENTYDKDIDTSRYTIPASPVKGSTSFKQLTLDLGLGYEIPIGSDVYIYGDIRTWIPTTHNTSPYLHNDKNVPLPIIGSFGLRILFDWAY
jgi:hypothetical protein